MHFPPFLRLALFLIPSLLCAAPPPPAPASDPRAIPEPLKAWESWATWDAPHRFCPTPYNTADTHICFWPSRLGLLVDRAGGKFDFSVTVFSETWVPLPGGKETWPADVTLNGTALPVVEHKGRPSVKLAPGTFRLEGAFRWKEIPQGISLPPEIGLLALTLEGQPVPSPTWDAEGYLWLKRDASLEEADKDFLSVKTYALLEDGIPLWLRTQVEIIVAGKSREEDLGSIQPEGWKLSSVDSPLPVMVDDAGRMKVQVRAGKWTLTANAFRLDNPTEFRFAADAKPAAEEELVAFRAKPDFRMVDITGSPSIDVSQTTFPAAWREYPVYRWDTATPFRIEERMRGMGLQTPQGLTIRRLMWLDENGRGLTFRDTISGSMQQIWRLDAAEGQDLGSVRSNGQGQLITLNPQNNAPGVEIRTRNLNLEATGRMERTAALPATGWRADADSLNVALNLPPGWRLFALFGADWVKGDWLTAWTLLDLFLLLIFSLAVFRLWGVVPAIVAFLAFGISYHEPGAPRFIWLALIIPLALLKVVPEGWGRRIVQIGKWAAIVVLVLIAAPFVSKQVQQALFPQLEQVPPQWMQQSLVAGMASGEAAPVPNAPAPQSETSSINQRLNSIILPRIDFQDATIREALDFLQSKSEGIPILLRLPPGSSEANTRITLALTNIPLREALNYVAAASNLKLKVEPNSVTIVLMSESTGGLVMKEYRVPPGFIPSSPTNGSGPRQSGKDFLESSGVTFPPGASATFLPGSSTLVVRNTQENLDLIDTLTDASLAMPVDGEAQEILSDRGSMSSLKAYTGGWGKSSRDASDKSNLAYDAKARIQTGPGVPDWTWRTVTFGWNGPVTAAQEVRPILISVGLERVLTILRIALLLALAAILLDARRLGGSVFRAAGKAAVWVALLGLGLTTARAQEIPDKETLATLRERLLEPSDAYPTAATISSVALSLKDRKLSMDAEIHTAIRVAVPLPGRLPAWSPVSVTVDGKPEPALRRDDGYLWVVLPEGVHRVQVEGLLSDATEWEWTFQLKPRRVTIDAPGWNVSGVRPDGVPEQQVFFALQQKATAGQASYDRQDYQSLVVVQRHIELGLVWQVSTTVSRLSPEGKAVALRVPLLPGENVLSSNTVVKDGFIEVRLGAQDPAFTWQSEISPSPSLKLTTKADDSWVERWDLVASPVWNVTIAGLPPVFLPGNPELVPVWHPWPGESVDLTISRPEAIAGATVTVNNGTHAISLGKRQRTAKLNLSLRCSLGEDFLIGLPTGAEVTALTFNNQTIPVRKDGDKVIVPLRPGEQNLSLEWKTNAPLGFQARAEQVTLPVESANITTVITVPDNRWVLWTDGPLRGPAVRFWTVLVCCLLAAWALGRLPGSPLRPVEWMLLAVGLTQVPLVIALIVVGWLFFLAWRGRESFLRLPVPAFNFLQVALIGITAVSLGIFIGVVAQGLLGDPRMFIAGNTSTNTLLDWYQPRCETVLPTPGCFSVSIWWFRILMLGWALWLAASLLRWLRWAWVQFSTGGCFRKTEEKTATPPPLDAA